MVKLALRAQLNNLSKPFHFVSVARNTVPGMARALAGLRRGTSRVKEVPRTRFNGTVSPHRVFDAFNVPLDDIKKIKNAVPGATVNDTAITIVGGALRRYLAERMNPPVNCVITNVPGPSIPLYNTGAKMVANYGTGPVGDGLGLFHAIGSYCGQFMISATSCRRMIPDPQFYRQCLQDSFVELRAAASKVRIGPKAGTGARAKPRSRAKA